jgi:hypothetical protein
MDEIEHMLETIAYISAGLISLAGIFTAVWSVMRTRNKYYQDYRRRKR